MSTWTPIEKELLLDMIRNAELILEGLNKGFWRLIKLQQPEKWQQTSMGDLGDGFWVVAVLGNHCIYYNDIEEGFNISKYDKVGYINEYLCEQLELEQLISSIVHRRFNL